MILKILNFRNKSFTKIYRCMHLIPLGINVDRVRQVSQKYLDDNPTAHLLEQCAFDDRAIIETLEQQIRGFENPRIKVLHANKFRQFLNDLDVNSVDSLRKLVGFSISVEQLKVHSFLRDELLNNFLPFTPSPVFAMLVKTYGLHYGIQPLIQSYMTIIGTKICHSIELNPEIKSYFIDKSFRITPPLLSIIAGNCLLGGLLYNMDFHVVANFTFDLNNMIDQLKLIKKLYEYYGIGINLLNVDLESLPSTMQLVNNIHPTIESISSSLSSNFNDYQLNRLFFKKIPIIGNLIFQIVDYCCRGNNYINIAPFVEKTVDLAVKYSLEIGHFFHLFSNIHYTTPHIDTLAESSNGDGGDGSDKNPSFNRKVKVIGGFALGFALVVGVAKLFGNS